MQKSSDCIDHGATPHRYGYKNTYHDGQKASAHRVAYCVANGLRLSDIKGKVVMHTCDNKRCVNPEHLELGSASRNTADAYDRGLAPKLFGEANKGHVLTAEQVVEIKESTAGARELGRRFGVAHSTISRIRRGEHRPRG